MDEDYLDHKKHNYSVCAARVKVIMLGTYMYIGVGIYMSKKNLKSPLQADSPHHYPIEGSSCSL